MSEPTALAGANADRLLTEIAAGRSFRDACRRAGVSYPTFRFWMLRGGDPIARSRLPAAPAAEPYRSFARRVRAAETTGRRLDPPGPRRGRPPAAIPPAAQAAILDGLARGWTYHAACRRAGVRLSTFLGWLRLGGYPRPLTVARPLDPVHVVEPYRGFVQRVLEAEVLSIG